MSEAVCYVIQYRMGTGRHKWQRAKLVFNTYGEKRIGQPIPLLLNEPRRGGRGLLE